MYLAQMDYVQPVPQSLNIQSKTAVTTLIGSAERHALSNHVPNTAIPFSKALSMDKNVQDIHPGRAQR